MLYLDYCATTPMDPEVLKTYNTVNTEYWGNPSSLHQFGTLANQLFEKARNQCLEVLGAKRHQILFTSGATEANNLALFGIAKMYQNRGRHIITTAIEHSSVYQACEELAKMGFKITYLPVNPMGVINLEDLKAALTKETILVSTMFVNGEVGSIMPIQEISQIIKAYNPNIFYHVDLVQGVGKLPIQIETMGIDFATVSGHKIYGPKGVGALIYPKQTKIQPLVFGGGQQDGLRSGTIDVASIVAFSKALRLICEAQAQNYQYVRKLQAAFYERLRTCDFLTINSHETGSPYIINFSLHKAKAETIVGALSNYQIYVSSQSACSSKTSKPSRVLKAMGLNDQLATESLRISLSHLTNETDVERFFTILNQVMNEVMVK